MDWSKFDPTEFEYDFDNDELSRHHITLKEAIECFYNDFEMKAQQIVSGPISVDR